MHLFYYLRGAVGDRNLIDEHAVAVKRLLNGDYNSADLEKLKGHDVYSFRLNKAGRLLFSLVNLQGEECLLVLDHLPNHEYSKSRFLRSGVLRRYLEKVALASAEDSPEFAVADGEVFQKRISAVKAAAMDQAPGVVDFFQNKVIHLSHEQEGALSIKLPSGIRGGAGSGKTAVAVSLISSYVDSPEVISLEESRKILYVATSSRLVDTVQSAWQQLPQSVDCRHVVAFKSYADLVREQSDASQCPLVGESDFRAWYDDYCEKERTIAKAKRELYIALDARVVYQEFRICSAYSKENYEQIGGRQSLIDKEKRASIYVAYEHYCHYLNPSAKDRRIDPAFYHFDSDERGYWDLVLLDEGQDLGLGQLIEVTQLAKERQFVVCMDDNQRLNDELSVFSRGCDLLRIGVESRVTLHGSYRCPPQIMTIAKKVREFRDYLAQGTLDKYQDIDEVEQRSSKMGRAYILDEKDLASLPWLREAAKGTDFVVITSAHYVEEARARFNTPLVFTPESIKGLEYRMVVTWRLYSPEVFRAISLRLNELTGAKQPIHQAKKGSGTSQFNPPLHAIYTAYTRSTEMLLVCEPSAKDNMFLLEKIRPFTEKGLPEQGMMQYLASSQAQWLLEVNKQLDVGNERLAAEIFAAQSLGDAAAFAALIASRKRSSSPEPAVLEEKKSLSIGVYSALIPETVQPEAAAARRSKDKSLALKREQKESVVVSLSREEQQAQSLCADFNPQKLQIAITVFDAEKLLFAQVNFSDKKMTFINFILRDKTRMEAFFKLISNDLGMMIKVPFSALIRKLGDKIEAHSHFKELSKVQSKFLALSKSPATLKNYPLLVASILRYSEPKNTQLAERLGDAQKEAFKKKSITPLYLATYTENIVAVKLFAKLGANLEASTPDGMTPAFAAGYWGNLHTLEVLKKLGARLDSPLQNGVTLAIHAAQIGNTGLLRLLKKQGVDLEAADSCGWTPLCNAAAKGHSAVMRLFHEWGADLNAPMKDGFRPAFSAAQEGQVDVLRVLNELGVSLDTPNQNSFPNGTPACIAVRRKDLSLLRVLIELGVNPNTTAGSSTLAYLAAELGHVEVLPVLKELGADLAQPNADDVGGIPVCIAAQKGHVNVLRVLKELGADLEASDGTGSTPATIAAENGLVDVLRVLKELGVDLDAQEDNHDGNTPAFIAASQGNSDVLRVLKELGANLDLPAGDGITPVFIAVQEDQVDALRTLKELGVDFESTDDNGATLACIAAEYGHVDVLRVLKEFGVDLDEQAENDEGDTPAYIAALNNDTEVLRVLKELGANLDLHTGDGLTPVFIAAQEANIEALRVLKELGANLDAHNDDDDGTTAAYIAAQHGHDEVLRELKALGANLDTPMRAGATPLFIALQHGHLAIVNFLINSGCRLDARFITSSENLIAFSKEHSLVVQQNMSSHVEKHLATAGADKEHVPVSLIDIASIMGHEGCLAAVQEALSRKQEERLSRPSFFPAPVSAVVTDKEDTQQLRVGYKC
jgi:ankyrin repeat protein